MENKILTQKLDSPLLQMSLANHNKLALLLQLSKTKDIKPLRALILWVTKLCPIASTSLRLARIQGQSFSADVKRKF